MVIYDIAHFDVKVSSLCRDFLLRLKAKGTSTKLALVPYCRQSTHSALIVHRVLIGYSSSTRQVEKPAPRSTEEAS